jgi:hypothetical protein
VARALYDVQKVNVTQHSATPSFLPVAQGGIPKQAWQYDAWVGPGRHWGDKAWAEPAMLLEALRSYMANIAWTDAQVGKVLKSLAALNMRNNTVVLFTGDHGQNVGEHNTWSKMTAWEHSVRVPLIIAVPWLPASHNRMHYGMAEMCDFYKTLSDLANIDPATIDPGVECDSLAPLFHGQRADKLYAFSQTNRNSVASLKKQDLPPYTNLPVGADTFFDPTCLYGARFRQKFTLEDAIGSHACSLEANTRVTNGIPLGSSLLLPVCTVNCFQTLKACQRIQS